MADTLNNNRGDYIYQVCIVPGHGTVSAELVKDAAKEASSPPKRHLLSGALDFDILFGKNIMDDT